MVIVQKYGGQLLATPEKILQVAQKIQGLHKEGHKVIVTVSAMGRTTDELVGLANQISKNPVRREMDMLLSVGERISMSLLSMALNDLGVKAKSFTGSQTGILTEESHTSAKIIDVRPIRIQKELENHSVIIIAGFQGVSAQEKEITTLGRGGTDTTSVALAHALGADRLEIIKEVGGVYSADPKKVSGAILYENLDCKTLMEATFWGAKILHFRAVQLACKLKIPIFIHPMENSKAFSQIQGEGPMLEAQKVAMVSVLNQVLKVSFQRGSEQAFQELESLFKKHSCPWPQILLVQDQKGECDFYITSDEESLKYIQEVLQGSGHVSSIETLSCVTATCFGSVSSNMIHLLSQKLSENKISFHKIISSPQSLAFLVNPTDTQKAQEFLHSFVSE